MMRTTYYTTENRSSLYRTKSGNEASVILFNQVSIKEKDSVLEINSELNQLMIGGCLKGEHQILKMNNLLVRLIAELKQTDHFNIYIRPEEIDENGIIFLYNLLQQVSNFSNRGRQINIFWDTMNDVALFNIAIALEQGVDCQLFSIGKFSA